MFEINNHFINPLEVIYIHALTKRNAEDKKDYPCIYIKFTNGEGQFFGFKSEEERDKKLDYIINRMDSKLFKED